MVNAVKYDGMRDVLANMLRRYVHDDEWNLEIICRPSPKFDYNTGDK